MIFFFFNYYIASSEQKVDQIFNLQSLVLDINLYLRNYNNYKLVIYCAY